MNRKLIFVSAAAFAVCPFLIHAQTPPVAPAAPPTISAAPGVTLRYKFAVGQVHRYKYTMNMNMLMQTGQTGAGIPIDMTMAMTMRQTVKSIRPADGAATVVTQIETIRALANGQETPLPDAQASAMKQPFTQVMLPTGKILSMEAPSMGAGGMPGMDMGKSLFSGTAFLPDGPVKVGDDWNGTLASAMAGVETSFTSTLASVDQKDGKTLATITNKQTGTIDKTISQVLPTPMKMSGTLSGDGTQIFDTGAGTIQYATGTSNADMTMTIGKAADGTTPPGMPSAMKMQMKMKFSMERLSDAAPSTAAPVQ